jgi:hypothetical protein
MSDNSLVDQVIIQSYVDHERRQRRGYYDEQGLKHIIEADAALSRILLDRKKAKEEAAHYTKMNEIYSDVIHRIRGYNTDLSQALIRIWRITREPLSPELVEEIIGEIQSISFNALSHNEMPISFYDERRIEAMIASGTDLGITSTQEQVDACLIENRRDTLNHTVKMEEVQAKWNEQEKNNYDGD